MLAASQSVGERTGMSELIGRAARRASKRSDARGIEGAKATQFDSDPGKSGWKLSSWLRYNRSMGFGLAMLVVASTLTTRRRQNKAIDDALSRLDIAEKQCDEAKKIRARIRESLTQSAPIVAAEVLRTPQSDRSAHFKDWIHERFDQVLNLKADGAVLTNATATEK